MENTDLKYLKKHYGEKFAHLCRELFPTLLETEGLLKKLITDRFAFSRELYKDIIANSLQYDFKNYIFSFVDVEKENKEIITSSPEELLDKAGYKLYPECKTEEEIQSFRKYYAEGEELCTFNGGRLNSCRVWFAVKKNIEEIKRENFTNPSRQDEYGTSVISIQFTRRQPSTLSIKNRYNHRVNNQDATFGNNLDNIILGLTEAFVKEYQLSLINDKKQSLELPNYVLANDGKFYKYTLEINNIYYCGNNIIIDNGEVKSFDKNKYLVMENFILDIRNKNIYFYDKRLKDSFCESIGEIASIKRILDENGQTIEIAPKEGEVVKIKLDKANRIIELINTYVTKLGSHFLRYNRDLRELNLPNLESVGKDFLNNNIILHELNLPNLKSVGDYFLCVNKNLQELHLPNLQSVGDYFLYNNETLQDLDLPNLESVGSHFLYLSKNLQELDLPNLKSVGSDFLCWSKNLQELNLPNLRSVEDDFLYSNKNLQRLDLPNLESVGKGFLANNNVLQELDLPNLKSVGDRFLANNNILQELDLPNLESVGKGFLANNNVLQELDLPNLRSVEDCFLYSNKNLQRLDLPNLESVGSHFLRYNKDLRELNLPNLKSVGDSFLANNNILQELDLPNLKSVGDSFLANNNILQELDLPNLESVGQFFLSKNKNFKKVSTSQSSYNARNILNNEEGKEDY